MIDARTLQHFINAQGYSQPLKEDGVFGPRSYAGAHWCLKQANVNAGQWTNDRVWIGINQLFLNKTNAAQLIVDGMYGPRTGDALYIYSTTQLHTITNHWPRQADVRAGTSMFGKPGTNQAMVQCPFTMFGDYDRKIKVTHFQAHAKVAGSMERVLQRALDYYGAAKIRTLNLDIFSGCYNYRGVVGGSGLSMHAWGLAIDIDAAHNEMDEGKNEAVFARAVYAPFLDFWEEEGWVSLGRARNYDWMHIQAPRL